MVVNKYNFATKEYEKVDIPNNWHTPLYTKNLKEIINYISCGTKIEYGSGYTSMKYHNNAGFGYCVCHKCYYDIEWKERNFYNERN